MTDRYEEIEYEELQVHVLANPPHKGAVLLDYEGEQEWVPRTCFASEEDTVDLEEGEDAQVVLATWKLRELGWA